MLHLGSCSSVTPFPAFRRYDEHHHHRFPPGTEGRPFAYFVLTGGRFLYASAARLAVLKIVMSLSVRRVCSLFPGPYCSTNSTPPS